MGGPGAQPPTRPRATFSLEGRAAPGLYLAAWTLVLAGLGLLFVGFVGGGAAGVAAFVLGIAAVSIGLAAGAGAQALQRRADGAAYAGPSPVLVFAAAFGLTLVSGFAISAAGILPAGPPAVLISVVVSAVFSIGLVALVVVSPGALSWREMGLRLPGPGEGSALRDFAWGMALAIPTLFVAGVLASVLISLLGVAPESPIPPARDPAGIAVNLLAAVVIAPIWEEVFFRGFVATAWARTAGVRAAIVRSAIFFALVHVIVVGGADFRTALLAAVIAFAIRLPVGLVLGWIFLARRTLVAPVALHATYNAIPVLLVSAGLGGAPLS